MEVTHGLDAGHGLCIDVNTFLESVVDRGDPGSHAAGGRRRKELEDGKTASGKVTAKYALLEGRARGNVTHLDW